MFEFIFYQKRCVKNENKQTKNDNNNKTILSFEEKVTFFLLSYLPSSDDFTISPI